jgi:hypothetical protein
MASRRSISIFSLGERISTEDIGLFGKRRGLFRKVSAQPWITVMARLFNAIRNLAAEPQLLDDNVLRRRIRELEAENESLREKLAWRGPWLF